MNFLAHYLLATQFLPPPQAQAPYVVGTALPDLLSFAAPHKRLRLVSLSTAPQSSLEEQAVTKGVRAHLLTDAAFHKATAFHETQARVGEAVAQAGFVGIRVRRFFLAHVLTELALDAVLLRRQPNLADDFYRDFAAADHRAITRWAETTVGQTLPDLPGILADFSDAHYLDSYATDTGVAEGLRRLSLRARQDAFQGDNLQRLSSVVAEAITILADRADLLLAETGAAVDTDSHS